MQTCADELAPIFSTLPVLLENLRAAHYQLGVDSYLRVERLLLQLAAQGQLSLEPAQLKTQLLAVLRPLLCHSPLEQQQFTQHFEHWWQLVHASPVSNPSVSIETVKPSVSIETVKPGVSIETVKPKSRNKQHFLTLILLVGLLCSISSVQCLRPSSILLILSILFVSLSSLLLYLIRIRQKTQQFLNRYAVTETSTTQTLFVSQLQKQLFHTLELGQLAQRLRIRETLASTDLNISATIAKTLQAGNYFSPVYAERKRTPEYLILVDKQSFSDHHAALVDSLVARLQSEGVEITRYYFHGNPELCYQNSYQGVKLARLFALHGESRLLIFSDGAGLLDVMGELHLWLKDLLSWQVHCVLTLHDLRGWAAQALLRANFWVLPASESGLRGLVSLLHPQSATTRLQWDGSPMPRYLEERPLRWLTREKPSVAEEQELLQQLRKFLGKEGFEWLCACAVWHEVRWQMTLFFGYQLFGQDTAAISARLALLARLARLVWFKTGFMPDWLRRGLLAELSLTQKKLLRNSLFTLFGSAALEPASTDSMPIKIAQQAPVKKWQQATENQLNDVVFLEFSLVSNLAVPVPKMVGELLGQEVSTRHILGFTLDLIELVFYQIVRLIVFLFDQIQELRVNIFLFFKWEVLYVNVSEKMPAMQGAISPFTKGNALLRPTFTENLLQDLLRGNSINVHGAIGQGQARLLDDLVPLAKEKALLVLRVNMKSFARNYNFMIDKLNEQLRALFPDKTISCTNFSEVMKTLDEHAKTAKVLLMLENFDAVLDKPNPPEFTDLFNDLNRLRNQQHRLVLALTTKPYNQYIFYAKTIQRTSPLDLKLEELHKLSLQEIGAELKRRKILLNKQDLNLLKNRIHEHSYSFDFLEYCCGCLNAEAHQNLSFSERLKIWEEDFAKTRKKSVRLKINIFFDGFEYFFKEILHFLRRF